ncbi:MAG: hypothetical protein U0640_09615 [Phycisphaerales bacterium]
MNRIWLTFSLKLLVLIARFVSWAIVFAWVVGRIASDRFLWSQFLSWIPTLVPLAAALFLWFVSWQSKRHALQVSSKREDLSPSATRKSQSRFLARLSPSAITTTLLASWLIFVDIRVQALVFGLGTTTSPTTIRLLCWNATSVPVQRMASLVREQAPDIAILCNTPFSASLVPIRDEMNAAAAASNKEPTTSAASSVRINVFSRFPVLHHAVMSLGITGAKERTFTWVGGGMKHIDTGQLMCVELDTTKALGKTTVLWVVDLPSDPDIPRARMMREFQTASTNFAAPIMRRTADGLDRQVPPDQRTEVLERLQHPDIIAGDFNTTRDSASLAHFLKTLGSFEHAKNQSIGTGGIGWDCTYPRTLPLLHIDHVFIGESSLMQATSYSTFDPLMGRHAAQFVELHLPK